MTKKHIPHNKICYACKSERGRSHMGYDIRTLKTYCMKNCPNEELIPSVPLIPFTDLVSEIVATYSEEVEESLMARMGTIVSTRLQPAQVMHLVKLMDLEGLPSIQATLINIIEADMESRSLDHVELEGNDGSKPEVEEEPIPVAKPKPQPKPKAPKKEKPVPVPEPEIEPVVEEVEGDEVDDDEFSF